MPRVQVPSSRDFAQRALHFVTRHIWSLSLSGLSAFTFLGLASEIREGELGAFDGAVAGWLVAIRGPWDWIMLTLTRVGDFPGMATLCVLATIVLVLVGRLREARYVVACAAGSGLLSVALKLVFHRVRPDATALYMLTTPGSFSFPSGHAMGTTGVVGSLVIVAFAWPVSRPWRALAVIVAASLIVGVAASRVYFGVHYPSDVVGGQLAAAAWVAALTGWFYPRLLPQEAAVSTAPP